MRVSRRAFVQAAAALFAAPVAFIEATLPAVEPINGVQFVADTDLPATAESVAEVHAALAELRQQTDVVAAFEARLLDLHERVYARLNEATRPFIGQSNVTADTCRQMAAIAKQVIDELVPTSQCVVTAAPGNSPNSIQLSLEVVLPPTLDELPIVPKE